MSSHPSPGSDTAPDQRGVGLQFRKDEDGEVEVAVGRRSGQSWWDMVGVVGGRGRGVGEIEHGDVDILAPLAADPAGVDGRGDGIGVVGVDVAAPEGTATADLFAFFRLQVEAGHADGEGAVLLAVEAGERCRRGDVAEFGGFVGSVGGWDADDGCVEGGAEVVAGEVFDAVQDGCAGDGDGWLAWLDDGTGLWFCGRLVLVMVVMVVVMVMVMRR